MGGLNVAGLVLTIIGPIVALSQPVKPGLRGSGSKHQSPSTAISHRSKSESVTFPSAPED